MTCYSIFNFRVSLLGFSMPNRMSHHLVSKFDTSGITQVLLYSLSIQNQIQFLAWALVIVY